MTRELNQILDEVRMSMEYDVYSRLHDEILAIESDFDETLLLKERISELESPRTCGTCIYMEQQVEDYFVCNCTEFQSCTTPTTRCFIGYKPKDTE